MNEKRSLPTVLSLAVADDHIQEIDLVANPDKLRRIPSP